MGFSIKVKFDGTLLIYHACTKLYLAQAQSSIAIPMCYTVLKKGSLEALHSALFLLGHATLCEKNPSD